MDLSIDELFACFETKEESEDKQILETNSRLSENVAIKRRSDVESENVLPKRSKTDNDFLEGINLEELRKKTVVHTIDTSSACTHEVVWPPGQDYVPLEAREGEPAKVYEFELDSFQKESILCVDNNHSVLVSAHTSAGKTVIAEYAIAKSLKNQQRVIYTTPIKALSNQKYRDFLKEFKDVGLVTGDVTINPNASCLIMTTEILRNMLFRGSEIMREVGWVIFDEIHYMRDKERGVVWEESIILLPDNVHYVFLSATIPNARQFAEWITHLHRQPCHVVYTDYRPTPLQHFIYPAGGNDIHMVVDETGKFNDDRFNAAMGALQNTGDAAKGDQKGRRGGVSGKDSTQTDIHKLIKMIMEKEFEPVIVFSFSKKECEFYANQLTKLAFNDKKEKLLIDEIFNNAMETLSEEDRQLPQVEHMLPLLRRGIGIHHGGLLPILKEVIEILFGEGLIKVLFATETFSIGLNMPARTVMFTSLKKFDGQDFRWISSGEYIQMSGRAGRRGKDDKGRVILMVNEKVPPATGRDIIKGHPDRLISAFHLTYNMVLNLSRLEEINPEYILERSFYQFQNQANMAVLYEDYRQKLKQYKAIEVNNEDQVASYEAIRHELDYLRSQFQTYITKSQYLVPFLHEGRLIKIKTPEAEYDWSPIIKFKKTSEVQKKIQKGGKTKTGAATKVTVDVLLHVLSKPNDSDNVLPKPCKDNECGEVEIVSVDSTFITRLSQIRLRCSQDLRYKDDRRMFFNTVKAAKRKYPEGLPLLDPIVHMNIKEADFKEIVRRIDVLEKKLNEHPMHKSETLAADCENYAKKCEFERALEEVKKKFIAAKSVLQMDELKCRKRVLRRLGYCSASDVIQLKGRVACELSGADELLVTEMLYNGLFGNLTPQQACALLSCLVWDESSKENTKISEELSAPWRQMQDLARRIAKVSEEAQLTIDVDRYVDKIKPSLMEVVFAWCNGATFADLCKMTEVFEGSIVRCMRRLEELLRQSVLAAKTMGNIELEHKFNEAIKLIKRDIIFSASLYL